MFKEKKNLKKISINIPLLNYCKIIVTSDLNRIILLNETTHNYNINRAHDIQYISINGYSYP